METNGTVPLSGGDLRDWEIEAGRQTGPVVVLVFSLLILWFYRDS